jgi:hypothetical protein
MVSSRKRYKSPFRKRRHLSLGTLSSQTQVNIVENVLQAIRAAGYEVTCTRGPLNTRRHVAVKIEITLPVNASPQNVCGHVINAVRSHSERNGYKRPHLWISFVPREKASAP